MMHYGSSPQVTECKDCDCSDIKGADVKINNRTLDYQQTVRTFVCGSIYTLIESDHQTAMSYTAIWSGKCTMFITESISEWIANDLEDRLRSFLINESMPLIDLNKRDTYGQTALTTAASSNKTSIVKMLLTEYSHRVDVNGTNGSGWTALNCAAATNKAEASPKSDEIRDEIVCMLLNHNGVDVDLPNNHGYSPFMSAANSGRHHVVRMLLNHGGVDVNRTSTITTWRGGGNALNCAAWEGDAKMVQLILDNGVDANYVNHGCIQIILNDPTSGGGVRNYTPLAGAVSKGHEDVVTLLLKHSEINVHCINGDG